MTRAFGNCRRLPKISIHMPHTWHDTMYYNRCRQTSRFQSTCHIRGMTLTGVIRLWYMLFQSTCHIRGMTASNRLRYRQTDISIHMPHTWHDCSPARLRCSSHLFQSTCHIRGMTQSCNDTVGVVVFQSTCHIRGMTLCVYLSSKSLVFQSTCHIRGMTSLT